MSCTQWLFSRLAAVILDLLSPLIGVAPLIAQLVKSPSAMQETLVQFLGWDDPLEKGKATHSSILGLPLWLSW